MDYYKPGYSKVAAIADLDADFLVFRKFGWLHNYALLYLQDELVQQQDELERFDRWEHEKGDPTKLVSRRKDQSFHNSRRKKLVGKLQFTLAQYGELARSIILPSTNVAADELLLRAQKIQAIKRPSQRSQNNVSNLILNTQSLVSDESDWIRHGPDLAALGRGAEHGWLNTFLEDALNKISRRATMASKFIFHLLSNISPAEKAEHMYMITAYASFPLTRSNRPSSAVMIRSSKLETKKNFNFSPQIVLMSSSTPCSQ